MKTEDLYNIISGIAKENRISKVYVVGGVPRDMLIGEGDNYRDIDLTTNYSDIIRLAMLCADYFGAFFRVFDDGHVSVYFENKTVDFSSNFISNDVRDHLSLKNIKDDFLYEVYSRDFTINTLHMDIESAEIIDPTGLAKEDISRRVIRTIATPEITLIDDPNRIFRAIELSSRLNFKIDSSIIDFVYSNREEIDRLDIKPAFIENIIARALAGNSTKTLENLIDMNIFDMVPLSGLFKEELIKRRMVKDYLDLSIG